MNKKERIKKLLEILNKDIVEKEDFIRISFLATLAGQNIFLYGPPGTAKSLIARRLSMAFETNNYFEHLMNRFSTPEELFGPISVKELKNDNYVRKTEGYLPKADFAFIDEIWKSSPSILNTLLTIINEKVFKNGNNVEKVPLKILVSASNEIPAEGQGLEALYDRFLLRLFVPPIKDADNFAKLLQSRSANSSDAQDIDDVRIKNDELKGWIESINDITLSSETLDIIHNIRIDIEEYNEKNPQDSIYISDRRWQRAAFLIKASAFYNDREETALIDNFVLDNCLWTSDTNRDKIKEIIKNAIIDYIEVDEVEFDDIDKNLASIEQLSQDKKLKTESFTYLWEIIPTLEQEKENILNEKKRNEVDSVFGKKEQLDAIAHNYNEADIEIETRLNKAISLRKSIYSDLTFNDIETRLVEIKTELKEHQVTIYEEDSLKSDGDHYILEINNRNYYINKNELIKGTQIQVYYNFYKYNYRAEFDGKILNVFDDNNNQIYSQDVHFKGLRKLSEDEMKASKQFFADALNDMQALSELIPTRKSEYIELFGAENNITDNYCGLIKDSINGIQTLVSEKMQEFFETYMFTKIDNELAKYKKEREYWIDDENLKSTNIHNEKFYECYVNCHYWYLKNSDLKGFNKGEKKNCYNSYGDKTGQYFSVKNQKITFCKYNGQPIGEPHKFDTKDVWTSPIGEELAADYRIVLYRLDLTQKDVIKTEQDFVSAEKDPESAKNFSAVCNRKIAEIDSIKEQITKEYE